MNYLDKPVLFSTILCIRDDKYEEFKSHLMDVTWEDLSDPAWFNCGNNELMDALNLSDKQVASINRTSKRILNIYHPSVPPIMCSHTDVVNKIDEGVSRAYRVPKESI